MKTSDKKRIALIMGGGSGTRFWPVSRPNKPKQFLNLTDENTSLLEQTVTNISTVFPRESIFLITGERLIDTTLQSNSGLIAGNIITEPHKRGTSGCIILAAAELLSRYGDEGRDITVGIFSADHYIADPERFGFLVNTALSVAESADALVIFGVKPDRPATGFGYLKLSGEAEQNIDTMPVYKVEKFYEKPDVETAAKYIDTGCYYWNSGMFFWRLSTFLDELKDVSPDLYDAVETLAQILKSGNQKRFRSVFEELDDISIDYALMEKAHRVLALEADFGWDDIGAWDALDRMNLQDENGNVIVGDSVVLDSKNCVVYNDSGECKTAVGVIGIEGLAVIVSDDGVLVVPKERAQEVKKVVSELKKRNNIQ